jgi:hypothetical protein
MNATGRIDATLIPLPLCVNGNNGPVNGQSSTPSILPPGKAETKPPAILFIFRFAGLENDE